MSTINTHSKRHACVPTRRSGVSSVIDPSSLRFESRCIHTGVYQDSTWNSVTTPIYPTSTFYWDDPENNRGFDYTRSGNPTRTGLEQNIAALEGGIDCRATSTGMSAITACMHLFKPGDHIICGDDIYGGTYRLFHDVYAPMGFEFSFVKMSDAANTKAAVRPNTKGIWIETPSNPILRLTDIAATAEIAREAGAISIADNTFLSPYLQRPFELGVDIVMHSTTKYLNGHSDVVGGCIVTRDQENAERVSYMVNALGVSNSPFDAWLVLRGIKTLGPRMEAHQRGAMALATMLDEHDAVDVVNYPGLTTHPQYDLAQKQQSGPGAMLSFEVKGGRPACEHIFKSLQLYHLGESLGGVESLIEYPATMSHASMSAAARAEAGITDSTIRVSVGIETPDDIVTDMRQALDTIPV